MGKFDEVAFTFKSISSGKVEITPYISIELNSTKTKLNTKKADHVLSVGAELVYTSRDKSQETFVVYFENPEQLEEGVVDLHNTIT